MSEMSPAAVARATLEAIDAERDAFRMDAWINLPYGRKSLGPEDHPSTCGTTLCAAGWACHVAGYIITADEMVYRPGSSKRESIRDVAARLLGLPPRTPLFFVREERAYNELTVIANGE